MSESRPSLMSVVVASLAVTRSALALRTLGFQRVGSELMQESNGTSAPRNWAGPRAIAATTRLPWSTCLTRSITLARQLRVRGSAAVLRIGVGSNTGDFHAHAWVEIDGQVIGDDRAIKERFTPLRKHP